MCRTHVLAYCLHGALGSKRMSCLVVVVVAATASMAKLWITEREVDGINRCVQFFGGYGWMNEYPIAQMYKDARIDTIHGGTSEIMRLLIARSL